jgi:signal transduction histidine kinase
VCRVQERRLGWQEVKVADNGSGMADEVLRRAFDCNFTTNQVGQGSGLGLGQVQRFVQESGSAIEIKSEVGIGTAVRMLLPVSRRPTVTVCRPVQIQLQILGPWGDGSDCD